MQTQHPQLHWQSVFQMQNERHPLHWQYPNVPIRQYLFQWSLSHPACNTRSASSKYDQQRAHQSVWIDHELILQQTDTQPNIIELWVNEAQVVATCERQFIQWWHAKGDFWRPWEEAPTAIYLSYPSAITFCNKRQCKRKQKFNEHFLQFVSKQNSKQLPTVGVNTNGQTRLRLRKLQQTNEWILRSGHDGVHNKT